MASFNILEELYKVQHNIIMAKSDSSKWSQYILGLNGLKSLTPRMSEGFLGLKGLESLNTLQEWLTPSTYVPGYPGTECTQS